MLAALGFLAASMAADRLEAQAPAATPPASLLPRQLPAAKPADPSPLPPLPTLPRVRGRVGRGAASRREAAGSPTSPMAPISAAIFSPLSRKRRGASTKRGTRAP